MTKLHIYLIHAYYVLARWENFVLGPDLFTCSRYIKLFYWIKETCVFDTLHCEIHKRIEKRQKYIIINTDTNNRNKIVY